MYKIKPIVFLLAILLTVLNCDNTKTKVHYYEDQIGDTPFNSEKDNSQFKFCDSTKVLHKRALVSYQGGQKNLETDIIKNYNFKPEYESFSGYFIIRFAVNCKDETGRFRTEVLDSNFKPAKCPNNLENEIRNTAKALKGWRHALYKGEDRDCYRFITIKMENGKIINP